MKSNFRFLAQEWFDKADEESCFVLNRYYVEARYPADMPEYPWKDVKEAVEAARTVKSSIEKIAK